MLNYDIHVYRDDRWWMIDIPHLDGLTQAEHFEEIEVMARDYIAVSTDAPFDEIGVRIVGDTEALLEIIENLKDRVSVHERTGDTISADTLADDLGLNRETENPES